MNIPAINNFNIFSIFRIRQNDIKTKSFSNFGLKMSKPLTHDTVNFGAVTDHFNYKRPGITIETARKIEKEYQYYKSQIDAIFTLLLASLMVTKEAPENPVEYITSRVKKHDSIKEKSEANGWKTEKEVKQKMTDLMGGKFVLNLSTKENAAKVINLFCNAIENKQIKLKQIENKVPKSVKTDDNIEIEQRYSYATLADLKKLYDTAVSNGNAPEYNLDNPFDFSNSNYTALHFLFEVPVKDTKGKLQWITVEVQGMGHDEAKHKNFDDIIFKLLNGKKVDKKYHKIVEIMTPYIIPKKLLTMSHDEILQLTDKDFQEMKFENLTKIPRQQLWENILIRNELDAYRAETFIQQREKEPIAPKDRNSEFEAFSYFPPNPQKYPHLCKCPKLYMGYLYTLKQQADANNVICKK